MDQQTREGMIMTLFRVYTKNKILMAIFRNRLDAENYVDMGIGNGIPLHIDEVDSYDKMWDLGE